MTITVEFPVIMKMYMTTTVEVKQGATLWEVKEKIYSDCWKPFVQKYNALMQMDVVSSPKDVILKADDVEILTNSDLREHQVFRATFNWI